MSENNNGNVTTFETEDGTVITISASNLYNDAEGREDDHEAAVAAVRDALSISAEY